MFLGDIKWVDANASYVVSVRRSDAGKLSAREDGRRSKRRSRSYTNANGEPRNSWIFRAYSIASASAAQNRHRQHIVAAATKRAMSTRERTTAFITITPKLNILIHSPKNAKIQYNISGSTIRPISNVRTAPLTITTLDPIFPRFPTIPDTDPLSPINNASLSWSTTCPPSLARIPPLPWT